MAALGSHLSSHHINQHAEIVWRAPGVVYIESVVIYHSLHIHHQIVHTSHFPIFSRPKPGGGVYLLGPYNGTSSRTWKRVKTNQQIVSYCILLGYLADFRHGFFVDFHTWGLAL